MWTAPIDNLRHAAKEMLRHRGIEPDTFSDERIARTLRMEVAESDDLDDREFMLGLAESIEALIR